MGRSAAGVKGIDLMGGKVVGVALSSMGESVMSLSENGFGKRSLIADYRLTDRGTKGVKTLQTSDATGPLVAFRSVLGDEDAMIVTDTGQMIRIHLKNVKIQGRNTKGVRIIRLSDGDKVMRMAITDHEESETEQEMISQSGDESVMPDELVEMNQMEAEEDQE